MLTITSFAALGGSLLGWPSPTSGVRPLVNHRPSSRNLRIERGVCGAKSADRNCSLALLGTATIVTALWPTWIEGLFGFDPDGGNGTAEWWIVAVLAVITVASAALARRDLRVVRRRASVSTP